MNFIYFRYHSTGLHLWQVIFYVGVPLLQFVLVFKDTQTPIHSWDICTHNFLISQISYLWLFTNYSFMYIDMCLNATNVMMVLGPLGFWIVVHILIFWHLRSILSIFQLVHLWSYIQHIFGLSWTIFDLWHLTFDINDNIYSTPTTQDLLQTPSHYKFPFKNLLVSLDAISIDLFHDIFYINFYWSSCMLVPIYYILLKY